MTRTDHVTSLMGTKSESQVITSLGPDDVLVVNMVDGAHSYTALFGRVA